MGRHESRDCDDERAGFVAKALDARGVSKTFSGGRALVDFDLEIGSGEIHAVVGENGSGKSTFIKILAGFHEPDPGATIMVGDSDLLAANRRGRDLGCRFVHQDLALVETESVADNLFYGRPFPSRLGVVRSRALQSAARGMLEAVGLDVNPGTKVSALSPATKTGVAVARALRPGEEGRPTLLVLDEPTATLPESEVCVLLAIVRRLACNGVGVLYVSHRLDEVFEIATNVTALREGHRVATRRADGLSRRDLLDMMLGENFDEALRSIPVAAGASLDGPEALVVEGLRARSLDGVSFSGAPGEIVGVAGITGSGREVLLGTIFGAHQRVNGTVHVFGEELPANRPDRAIEKRVAYVPPSRRLAGFMDLRAAENVSLSDLRPLRRWGRVWPRAELTEARRWFDTLDVRPREGENRPLLTFSGGNQQKIILARCLRRSPSIFLLEEPTQGVDVGAKATIHRKLVEAAAGGALVIVSSSDADELAYVCTRVVVLRGGRLCEELRGSEVTARAISRASLEDEGGDLLVDVAANRAGISPS